MGSLKIRGAETNVGPSDAGPQPLVDRWYRQFNERLIEFLRQGVRAPADVQDLAQEIYLRLLRVKNPELIESPRAYLYRIAIHVLDEWRTRERRDGLHSSDRLKDLVATSGIDGNSHRRDVVVDMRRALRDLPAMYSATLILRWHHGMSYREIAEHLDVSERMVKRYIVKGYVELRTRMEHEIELNP